MIAAVAFACVAGALQAADTPHSFTIAVLPDTQNYMDYTHQRAENFPFDANELFMQQMQYVADNTISQGGDIAFVTSLGDVWQHQTLKIDPGHAARSDAVPSIQVRTYSTHYKKQSIEASEYAGWYKAQEKPQLSDEEYLRQDHFDFQLTDFRERFGAPAAAQQGKPKISGAAAH